MDEAIKSMFTLKNLVLSGIAACVMVYGEQLWDLLAKDRAAEAEAAPAAPAAV